jgi:glucosamine--fructose-6-phosphate aminotransferase (isomerizing)
VGKGFIESITKLPAQAEIASEFRYANQVIRDTDLVVALTQSGETADTLEAMEKAKQAGAVLIAITNVLDSQSTRIADASLHMRAGIEVGVASTKTFTSSLLILYILSIYLGKNRSSVSEIELTEHIHDLEKLPEYIGNALNESPNIHLLAKDYANTQHFLFMARGLLFPIALEGALKLKEISYIHAEGHPAGEMKHGPIALIGPDVTTIALAPNVPNKEKTETTIEEIKTRNGVVLGVVTAGDSNLASRLDGCLFLPSVPVNLVPIVAAIPMQLFAYFIALEKELDIDHPRNLAKSVTVE